ncbi:MAG: hypothetical protein M3Z30_11250 [Gemmatimonadota bacterium]|nr:hypothetical protein [Gemmatimonadota bacterium]
MPVSHTRSGGGVESGQSGEPRWPAGLAVVAAGFLPFALPPALRLGPAIALPVAIAVIIVAATVARRKGSERLNEWLSYASVSLLTVALAYGLATLILALPRHTEVAQQLLRSALVLWVANVIVFAAWYWRLDAGGPNARDSRQAHVRGAFLFPQMAIMEPGQDGRSVAEVEGWRPGFVDYLALSLYTCTAFSPTDVPVLSRWAKLMMMIQSVLSLGTVVLLAARAVNIL